jgi:anti-sigma B factor antagonist
MTYTYGQSVEGSLLEVSAVAVDDRCLVMLRGELDLETAPAARDAIDAAITPGVTEIHIDASELWFIDSTGLKLLVFTARTFRAAGGEFRIDSASLQLRRMLDMLALTEHLNLAAI